MMVKSSFRKGKRYYCLIFSLLLLLFMADNGCVFCAHAAQSAVTSVSLTEDAQSAAGETVLAAPLCRTGDRQLLLSYSTGSGVPVTGLVVGYQNEASVNVNGAVYVKASDADLHCGSGKAAFLYYTTDKSAGDPILSFYLKRGSGMNDEPLFALQNDGSEPLRDVSGAVFSTDPSETTYLYILRSGICRPYISSILPVSGATTQAAVLAAANAGCNYYYENGLADAKGKPMVIGYTRTAQESAALRAITVQNDGGETVTINGAVYQSVGGVRPGGETAGTVFVSRDAGAGNPILALTGSAVPVRSTDVLGKWTEKTFTKTGSPAAAAIAQGETSYQELCRSNEGLTNVPVVSANGAKTALAYKCVLVGLPAAAPAATETEPVPEETEVASTDMSSVEPTDIEPNTTEPSGAEQSSFETNDIDPSNNEPSGAATEIIDPNIVESSDAEPGVDGSAEAESSIDEANNSEPNTDAPEDVASIFGKGGKTGLVVLILGVVSIAAVIVLLARKKKLTKKDRRHGE